MFGAGSGVRDPRTRREVSHKIQIRTTPSQRPGERGAVSRTSVAAILVLVLVLVVPAHIAGAPAAAGPPATSTSPAVPAPTDSHSRPAGMGGVDASRPEIPLGAPPRALYPSDVSSSTPGGPAPLLRSAIDRHNFTAAWAAGYRGQGVNVAVVDQGVDFGHPDLNQS